MMYHTDDPTTTDDWLWMQGKAWSLIRRLIAAGTPTEWCAISSEADNEAHSWLQAYAPCQLEMPLPENELVRCAILARLRHALVDIKKGLAENIPTDMDGPAFNYYAIVVDGWEEEFRAKWEQRDPGLIPFESPSMVR